MSLQGEDSNQSSRYKEKPLQGSGSGPAEGSLTSKLDQLVVSSLNCLRSIQLCYLLCCSCQCRRCHAACGLHRNDTLTKPAKDKVFVDDAARGLHRNDTLTKAAIDKVFASNAACGLHRCELLTKPAEDTVIGEQDVAR